MRFFAALLFGTALVFPAEGGEGASPADLNRLALEALREGDHDRAVSLLERAHELTDDPVIARNLGVALNDRALARIAEGRPFAAVRDLERAVALDPKEPSFRIHLGYAWLRAFDLERAERELREAARRFPDEPKAWDFLGFALSMRDELEEAERVFEKRLRLAEDDWARRQLAKVRRERSARREAVDRSSMDFTVKSLGLAAGAYAAGEVLSLLERVRAEVCSRLDFFPSGRTIVLLYPESDFRRATGTHGWVGGLYDGKIRVPVRDVRRDRGRLLRTLRHEYAHRVLAEMAPSLPTWLNEGVAEWLEAGGEGMHDEARRLLAEGRDLPQLSKMPRSFVDSADASLAHARYAVARSFVGFLRERYGPLPFQAFLKDVGRGEEPDAAARRWFGLDLSGLETLWRREALGERR